MIDGKTAQLTFSPVPLPASGGLLAMGLVPLMFLWLRKKPGSGTADPSFAAAW